MEFTYNQVFPKWRHQKTESNGYFVVQGETRISIPDFYETAKEYVKKHPEYKDYEIYFNNELDVVPGLKRIDGGAYNVYCDVTTGEWGPKYRGREYYDARLYELANGNTKSELSDVRKRLTKLEAIFDHIREKSSILDEFLKVADEVTK